MQALHGNTDKREKPTDLEIERSLNDFEIQPFVVTKADGAIACITEFSAVSLIYRYCSSLSKYLVLAPTWVKKEVIVKNEKFFKVSIVEEYNQKNIPYFVAP